MEHQQISRNSNISDQSLVTIRLTAIQFLRFVAAIMVVIFHANIFTNSIYPRPSFDPMVMFSLIGTAGVPIFFSISGFIVFYTSRNLFSQEGSTRKFLMRRLARIYPIYWIALVVYFNFLTDFKTISGLENFLGLIFLIPGDGDVVISPAWTLSYELYFYILFGMMLLLTRSTAVIALSVLFFLCVFVGRATGIGINNPWLEMVINPVLLEFLAGVYIGWILLTPGLFRFFDHTNIVRILFVAAAIGFVLIPFLSVYNLPNILLLGLPSALIVACAVFAEKLNLVPNIVRKLSFLGDSSYSLYLIHMLAMAKAMPIARALSESYWFARDRNDFFDSYFFCFRTGDAPVARASGARIYSRKVGPRRINRQLIRRITCISNRFDIPFSPDHMKRLFKRRKFTCRNRLAHATHQFLIIMQIMPGQQH